ncbi:hypothetical protein GQX73_g2133 [Xylaria multiplex]|uniref:F-box domain-containing protein n=1 Tax=Xylaria multiplex TaxID=323545 RepID=A0A7C8IW01_9PEZI|nr:hypothetical protein GQX73_g2133 [Xylaria multiplex]
MDLARSEKEPPFLQLPVELFLQIWEYLSVDDILAFRLVCRHIETLLFDPFCREFFTERRFSITFHSLKALVDISLCSRLKNCLTRLTIGLDRLHTSDALARFADNWDSIHFPDPPLVKTGIDPYKLEALTHEQEFLVNSGKFQLMLSKALGNLSCLEEFSLRDYNVPRKNRREGLNRLLVSYGWSRILEETGINFTDTGSHLGSYDERFVDIVFSGALLALAQSQIRINALTVDISQGNLGLSSSAFSLPGFFHQDVHPTLFNLRSLDLSVSFTQIMLGSYSSRSNSFLRWQTHQLFAFLQQAPNLVTLRVESKEQGFFVDGIVGWLASLLDDQTEPGKNSEVDEAHSRLTFPGDPTAMMLPHFDHHFHALTELQLGNMRAPARTVCKIMNGLSRSLRRLTLYKMALCVESDDDDELDNDPEKPNAWSAVFLYMHGLVQLEQLALSSLEHHTPSCSRQNGHPVAFFPSNFGVQSGPSNGLLHAWSHQGGADTIRDFLEELHTKTIILCRKCKQRNAGYRSVEEILEI